MVLRESAGVVAAGAALGIPLTVIAGRGLSAFLFGVGSANPLALSAAIALLFSVAMGAAYLPARRAARVDPLAALRTD
jgi:ABC-type antimicrobial peptide transport system permease subunit